MPNKTFYPKSDPQMRGIRLKTIRSMTGLTRQDFEKKHEISASTIQSWEAAKAGGLTERGASRLLPIFQKEGIACNLDWILYGIGDPPFLEDTETAIKTEHSITHDTNSPESKGIVQELLTFRKMNEFAVDFQIKDDGMAPHYNIGDYVAGKRRFNENLSSLIGFDCIVQTASNEILFRRLTEGKNPGVFNLICINLNTSVSLRTMYDQEIISAAPVIWHRRIETVE